MVSKGRYPVCFLRCRRAIKERLVVPYGMGAAFEKNVRVLTHSLMARLDEEAAALLEKHEGENPEWLREMSVEMLNGTDQEPPVEEELPPPPPPASPPGEEEAPATPHFDECGGEAAPGTPPVQQQGVTNAANRLRIKLFG